MTSVTTGQTALEVPSKETVQATVPRKRRRRAPATGAAEDCFTCRKRNTKCDRKRPYCTQCVELGKDCSGYRTTLTWGVGVASRGKLRGMTLPIPKSPSASNDKKTTTDSKTQQQKSSSPTNTAAKVATPAASAKPTLDFNSSPQPTAPATMMTTASDYFAMSATSPIPIPAPSHHRHQHHHSPHHQHSAMEWQQFPAFQDHKVDFGIMTTGKVGHLAPSRPHTLHRLHTAPVLGVSYDDTISAGTGSISAYSDRDYPSPSDYGHQSDDFSFPESNMQQYAGIYINEPQSVGSLDDFFQGVTRYRSMSDAMSSSMSSEHSHQDFFEPQNQPYTSAGGFEPIYEHDMGGSMTLVNHQGHNNTTGTGSYYQQMENLLAESLAADSGSFLPPLPGAEMAASFAIPRSILPHQIYSLSPRMQFLLDYYDKAICPVLVAFDGPTNPYRMHVIHLALESEGLLNAIGALSVNNLRMRGGLENKRIGYDQTSCSSPGGSSTILPGHAYSSVTTQELREMHGDPTQEELGYKAASIEYLNKQLSNPSAAKDDSVLATLLILCLFHVCDSGFSKFKTQLAGVQKLLSMRDRTHQSNFVGWIEVFFTWFDVMSSCVNEREPAVNPETLDMLNLSTNLGALEHLAGCEGRLFKLIARLGRLNLLSQNKPVSSATDTTPRPSPQPKRAKDYYSLAMDRGSASPPTESAVQLHEDNRTEFWREWHDIRQRLQEWELEVAPPSPSGIPVAAMCGASPIALDPSQRDLLHISESFRYSALLYIERLAHPSLPSSAINLQTNVAQALFHISHIGITSCVNKFLLWPLFIAGTECVDEHHRAIVRQRCVEIQRESGFFNNLSGLEVLERTWRQKEDRRKDAPVGSQPFKWRKAMESVDGEYVLI